MTDTEQKEGAVDLGKVSKDPPKKRCSCKKILFWTSAVIVGLAGILAGYVYVHTREREIPQEVYQTLGFEGVQMFTAHDRDGDGYLSIVECEALYHRFVGKSSNITFEVEVYEQPIEEHDYMVTLQAKFKPLLLSSMTKDLDFESTLLGYGELDPLEGLKNWREPRKEWMNFAVRHFSPFLPPGSVYNAVGEVYYITEERLDMFNFIGGDLSSNRYFPPRVDDDSVAIHRMLTMFHPHPFIMNRFRPRGAVGIIRAKNDKYLDIVFRIHAEFQLNNPPNHPFWFTPGQFTGHLVISKDQTEILHFNMYVPADKKLNVDMEWLQGVRGMEVDIGFMPEMSLQTTGPSVVGKDFNIEEKIPEKQLDLDKIEWTKEISMEKALADLEVKMYPFKKALKKDSTQPDYSKVASHLHAHYKFPVMMMVTHSNGSVIHKINANDYLDGTNEGSIFASHADSYVNFLKEGIQKAEAGILEEL